MYTAIMIKVAVSIKPCEVQFQLPNSGLQRHHNLQTKILPLIPMQLYVYYYELSVGPALILMVAAVVTGQVKNQTL